MKVEIWSDVVCPWCYIGKRRFEAALARFPHAGDIELTWRSFELDATAPTVAEGAYVDRLATKYGRSTAEAQQMLDSMTSAAASEGLAFDFEVARGGNTFDAHRLLHLAKERGVQDAVKERFDLAMFSEGALMSDAETLVGLAADAGLDPAEAREVLASDGYATDVRADEAQAQAYGISGVPFFVVDGRYGVSGAQPVEVITQVLEQAWAERSPLAMVGSPVGGPIDGAPGCDGDACAV